MLLILRISNNNLTCLKFYNLNCHSYHITISTTFLIGFYQSFLMNEAYVLLNIDYKKQKEIIEKAKKIPTVKEVKILYGIYEILIIFVSDDMQKIKQSIDEDLPNLDGITNITSLITID